MTCSFCNTSNQCNNKPQPRPCRCQRVPSTLPKPEDTKMMNFRCHMSWCWWTSERPQVLCDVTGYTPTRWTDGLTMRIRSGRMRADSIVRMHQCLADTYICRVQGAGLEFRSFVYFYPIQLHDIHVFTYMIYTCIRYT